MKKDGYEKKTVLRPKAPDQVQQCPIITDPQGCYTGKPIEQWETPVQDADDL